MRAVSSWTRNKQRLHVCAACHHGIRWLEALAQFSLLDKRARKNEGILQAINLPKCDVEKGVAEAVSARRQITVPRRSRRSGLRLRCSARASPMF